MKNIERAKQYVLREHHTLLSLWCRMKEELVKEFCASLFYCFYDNKKIVLICFDWMVQTHCPVTNY